MPSAFRVGFPRFDGSTFQEGNVTVLSPFTGPFYLLFRLVIFIMSVAVMTRY